MRSQPKSELFLINFDRFIRLKRRLRGPAAPYRAAQSVLESARMVKINLKLGSHLTVNGNFNLHMMLKK